jgi:glycosyltransferase involved in cell wall biosynthesis
MRILAVNYEYPPLGGGGGVILRDIVEELAARGHEVTVLTSGFEGLEPVERVGKRIEIHRVPVWGRKELPTASMPSMLSFWPQGLKYGKRLLQSKEFDVVNTHFLVPSGPVGQKLAELAGVPHVLSVHGGDIFDPSKKNSPHRRWALRALGRRLLRRADRVVTASRDIVDKTHRYYLHDLDIQLIPLGIKPTAPVEARREDYGIAADRFLMTTTGRLVERKKVDDLVRVMAKLDDPRDLLVVMGDGPKRGEWEALAQELGVAERVQFRGFVEQREKEQLTQLADAYVSTSTHEGFGLVFVEAMDRGLPVVSFDRGGHVDYLVDGETGGVAPLGNIDAFAERVARLKNDPEFRRRCAEHVKETAKQFHIGVCAGRYERLFEELIQQRAEGVGAAA